MSEQDKREVERLRGLLRDGAELRDLSVDEVGLLWLDSLEQENARLARLIGLLGPPDRPKPMPPARGRLRLVDSERRAA